MVLTRHAQTRKCQRSIPQYVISAAYEFGTSYRVNGDACSYSLDRKSVELAGESYGRRITASLSRYIGVYIIVGEGGQVVTAARSKRRLPRK